MSPGRSLLFTFVAVASSGLPGCSLMEPWGAAWHDMKRMAMPKTSDRRELTEESQEQWNFVGEEGRRGQEVEKDPDQWYRKYIMSEKARSIEENLGFE